MAQAGLALSRLPGLCLRPGDGEAKAKPDRPANEQTQPHSPRLRLTRAIFRQIRGIQYFVCVFSNRIKYSIFLF